MRFGRLFRSGALSPHAPEDEARLAGLGVRIIWDLRRARERSHAPSRWPGEAVECRYFDDPADEATWPIRGESTTSTVFDMRATMIALYAQMPQWLRPRLKGLFAAIAQGDIPLIFHCSAGKDRTGVAAALVLSAIGVPRETIYEDYLLTNEAVDLERHFFRAADTALGLGRSWEGLARLSNEARRALFVADADYLGAAFTAIELAHGTVERYLEAELGVGPAERERLREVLVEE